MYNFKIYSRAVILNKNKDKVLLIKKNNKQKIASNNWMLPWWTLEFNEEIELSLIREIKEETNLEITDLQLITSKKILIWNTHWLWLYYIVNIKNENDLINIEKDKHEVVKFVSLKDVPSLKDYSILQFIKWINLNKEFFNAFSTNTSKHSMCEALPKYIITKIHSLLKDNVELFSRIKIIWNYDRSIHVSKDEKNDKIFNFKRPTAFIDWDILYISCFPWIDYIYHYAKLIKTFLKINNIDKEVSYIKPSNELINNTFNQTNLWLIPDSDIIIFWNIDKIGIFENIPFEWKWDFLRKTDIINNKKVLLLWCKFSIWWSSWYDLIKNLSKNHNFSTFIYVGKLWSLKNNINPNQFIATWWESLIKNSKIKWNNLFENVNDENVIFWKHITMPSVLDETKENVNILKNKYDFIDPEIWNMALACKEENKVFSYLHFISDNVVEHNKLENLSNERKKNIIQKRNKLFNKIGKIIIDNLR